MREHRDGGVPIQRFYKRWHGFFGIVSEDGEGEGGLVFS
jgi:hypothetical protein